MSKCTAKEALKAFEYWLGYYEKASSAYSTTRDKSAFTKNKGSANYTYAGYICGINGPAAAWCAMQVSLSTYEACGNDKASAKEVLWGVWPYSRCDQLYDAAPSNMKGRRGSWTPKPGDVIVFSDNGSSRDHTGMVYAVDSKYVYTYEGNSGNMCRKRSYLLTSSYIWGYVRPNYAAEFDPWEKGSDGEWRCKNKTGEYVSDMWVESDNNLWYYIGPDEKMLHGGLTFVHECKGLNKSGGDAGTFPAGWFYLQPDNTNGMLGAMKTGNLTIVKSTTDKVQGVNTAVFGEAHNGHFGACVSVNGKAVKDYTELP